MKHERNIIKTTSKHQRNIIETFAKYLRNIHKTKHRGIWNIGWKQNISETLKQQQVKEATGETLKQSKRSLLLGPQPEPR